MSLTQLSRHKNFDGYQSTHSHESTELQCLMRFAVFLPPQAEKGPVPVIYWLSGLTCNHLNFITKAGGQKYAAHHGVALVCPDTSPRNCNIPGEDESWDFGLGAGFYVDATQPPWDKNYRMYSYVTKELPQLVADNFPVDVTRQSIMGHSMGGHGALICALKNPGMYRSVSAFAPICHPSDCEWGKKAFTGYLGDDEETWREYDATFLAPVYRGPNVPVFIDQGGSDEYFLSGQLLTSKFMKGCKNQLISVTLKMREGYDHSYYYIASFIEEHIAFHAQRLQ